MLGLTKISRKLSTGNTTNFLIRKKCIHAFFYKKVVYKKVLLDRPKPSKKIKKVFVLAPKT